MTTDTLFRWGRLAARRPWAVVAAWLATLAIALAASVGFGGEFEDSFGAPGLDSQEAADLLASVGAADAGLSAHVVLAAPEGAGFDRPGRPERDLAAVRDQVAALPHVLGVDQQVAPAGDIAILVVRYPALEDLEPADLDRLKAAVERAPTDAATQVEMGGPLFFAFEDGGAGGAEGIGLAIAVVVLLVAFGSLVAAGIPLVTAVLGLGISTLALTVVARLIDVPTWAPVLGSMVGLGVGIDYALLLVSRFREYVAAGESVPDAVGRATTTAGRSVLLAGVTVVVSILGLVVAGIPFMTAGAVSVSLIVLVMMAVSVTLVPALLGLGGGRVARRADRSGAESRRWSRWGWHVSRHPWAYAAGGTLVLLALAVPALSMRIGNPDDGTMPRERTERRAYDLVADGFGPGTNGPFVIAVETGGDKAVVDRVGAAVAADPGIAGVGPAEIADGGTVATVVATPTTGPQDEATVETLHRLRADVLPGALAGTSAQAHVGGQAATFADVGGRVSERLPWFVAAVTLVALLFLGVVFRSLLVPIKAAALNLLGIGASYGLLVMVFQWGWGADLIGLESTIPVVSFIPMFMFAMLFGLSMDYEVFLVSRIREEFRASGDPVAAVVHGIARTARLISSAALIMVAVFLGFVVGTDPFTKMFGLGLAAAIAIDATVVRLVLVPAVMTLMGRAAWQLPRRLARVLPQPGEPDPSGPSRPAPRPRARRVPRGAR
ncbi:MMPL family transporter [Nocardioides sp.]|uniref:MMPL family transporter n=1 Tax=Nocardioides sp. TaxID=35761 RepID=UPI002EDA8A54